MHRRAADSQLRVALLPFCCLPAGACWISFRFIYVASFVILDSDFVSFRLITGPIIILCN